MVRKEVTMSLKQATILVVDDERSVTDLLREDLGEEGYSCVTAGTGEDALKRLSEGNFDVVLLDLKLPGISGMDVLREAKSIHPEVAVIVVTAAGDAQTAVEAMKIGAVDYITKPFELERVNGSVEVALKAKTVWGDKSALQEEGSTTSAEGTGWTRYLDAVAEGVETRLDFLTGHVMTITVIERAIAVAQSLGIPENQIEKWADARRKHIERVNILDPLLR
jgi:DNA-binding NtrC family response regulator